MIEKLNYFGSSIQNMIIMFSLTVLHAMPLYSEGLLIQGQAKTTLLHEIFATL